jgi:hypothetical protein
MRKNFLNKETESDSVHSDDSESVYISQLKFYFLMMIDQNILKVLKMIFYILFLMIKESEQKLLI